MEICFSLLPFPTHHRRRRRLLGNDSQNLQYSATQSFRRPRIGACNLLLSLMCSCCVLRAIASKTSGSAVLGAGAQIFADSLFSHGATSWDCSRIKRRHRLGQYLASKHKGLRGGTPSMGNNGTLETNGSFPVGSESKATGGGQVDVHGARKSGEEVSGGQKRDASHRRVGVGAGHVAPLRVAPEEGDTIVGLTERCHTSSLVEAIWDACFESSASSSHAPGLEHEGVSEGPDRAAARIKRIYVRTGQQTWTGALVIPCGCHVGIVGPTSAQVPLNECLSWASWCLVEQTNCAQLPASPPCRPVWPMEAGALTARWWCLAVRSLGAPAWRGRFLHGNLCLLGGLSLEASYDSGRGRRMALSTRRAYQRRHWLAECMPRWLCV